MRHIFSLVTSGNLRTLEARREVGRWAVKLQSVSHQALSHRAGSISHPSAKDTTSRGRSDFKMYRRREGGRRQEAEGEQRHRTRSLQASKINTYQT